MKSHVGTGLTCAGLARKTVHPCLAFSLGPRAPRAPMHYVHVCLPPHYIHMHILYFVKYVHIYITRSQKQMSEIQRNAMPPRTQTNRDPREGRHSTTFSIFVFQKPPFFSLTRNLINLVYPSSISFNSRYSPWRGSRGGRTRPFWGAEN